MVDPHLTGIERVRADTEWEYAWQLEMSGIDHDRLHRAVCCQSASETDIEAMLRWRTEIRKRLA